MGTIVVCPCCLAHFDMKKVTEEGVHLCVCGGTPKIKDIGCAHPTVYCSSGDCSNEVSADTREKAILLWNRAMR